MFKKSLLALALVGASTSALAVNTTVANSINVSVEGQAADAAATTNESAEITLNLNAEYTVGDTVTLTLSNGAEFADTGYVLTGSSNVTFGLLNTTKTELTFRVTSRTPNTVTTGQTVQLKDSDTNGNNITFKLADLADKQKITVSAVAKTSTGITLDTATGTNTDSAELFVGAKQFEVKPTASNGTVDVAQLRKGFVKQGTTEQVPAPSFTFADNSGTGSWISTIVDDGFELKLTGDFTGVSAVNVGTAATDKFTIKDGTATLSSTTAALTGETINFVLPAADKRVALTAPQSFKLTATVKEGTTKSAVVLNDATVSTWSLNGDSEFVEIMPFSDVYSRAIMVTNNGTVEGDIMVELYSGGKMVAAKTVGSAAKYAVTNVTAAVDALAKENEITGVAGIRVTTNAPEANIEVSALYYNKDVQDHVKVN